MSESFTSGSFGNIVADSLKFHDYREVEHDGAGYSKFYTVISGSRKLFLKAINPENGSTAENISRLEREYKLFERLYGNEHIVRCIDLRNDPQVGLCIVMEFVDGMTLSEFLATSPSVSERNRILNELLDAVAFIHSHQVVHNDLKPENILITRNGHSVKLIDFGYADCDFSIDKATGGTKSYASPELLNGGEIDCKSDIYSIGLIIRTLFPHRYKLIARKCQHENADKRYKKVSDIAKAIRRRDMGLLLSIVVAVLGIALFVAAWLVNKWQDEPDLPVVDVPVQVTTVDSTENSTNVQEEVPSEAKTDLQPIVNKTDKKQNDVSKGESSLDFDSIHKCYYDLYDKYESELKAGIADGSLEYLEFAVHHYQLFAADLYCLKQKMVPDDNDLAVEVEKDYTAVYGMLTSKFNVILSKLPSYDVVKDKYVRDSLEQRLDVLRKQVMDKQVEVYNRK
ncbi:MAG: serine/threonine protein kinase [Bacteroidales bacterium]|nr:serine/threonine protein kinase [Bacteroidales bacterium]